MNKAPAADRAHPHISRQLNMPKKVNGTASCGCCGASIRVQTIRHETQVYRSCRCHEVTRRCHGCARCPAHCRCARPSEYGLGAR